MLLLDKFIAFTSVTLKRFIFTATLIVSSVTFFSVIAITCWIFLQQAREVADRNSVSTADQIRSSLYRAMEEGRSRADMEKILEEYRRQLPKEFHVALYLPSTIPDNNAAISTVFSKGQPLHHSTLNSFEHLFPFKAEDRCLECHRKARPSDVLGALEIREEISTMRNALVQRGIVSFVLLLPIPLLMALLVSRFVNRHLGDAICRLNRKVQSVSRVSDLTKVGEELEAESETLKFGELEEIFSGFGAFALRIKDVAVGKEMLEFEIKVLERFIITGDSIRDWKERVSFLLEEINKVMPAYALFCIFQIEDESFDIEVFWSAPPSATTRSFMEEIIHEQADHEHLRYRPGSTIQIIHNISNESKPLLDIDRHEIELETKSLYLEQPQIGGVVGIGVQSQIVMDPIRSLVINSILTTLLNVVGSIKAIYKYTRDLEYYATRDPLTNLYNHQDLHAMQLYPCAYSLTLNVSGHTLNAILNQRSQDMLVANSWNVTQYAVLVHLLAQVSGLAVGELVHVIADAHIYDRHVPLVRELITRTAYPAPTLSINPEIKDFYQFTVSDIELKTTRRARK